jgi:hypothetical protein
MFLKRLVRCFIDFFKGHNERNKSECSFIIRYLIVCFIIITALAIVMIWPVFFSNNAKGFAEGRYSLRDLFEMVIMLISYIVPCVYFEIKNTVRLLKRIFIITVIVSIIMTFVFLCRFNFSYADIGGTEELILNIWAFACAAAATVGISHFIGNIVRKIRNK